ncbi:MAG: efflux RND transporter periplasmic adaptor subunit [Gemmatimonadota bacterium]
MKRAFLTLGVFALMGGVVAGCRQSAASETDTSDETAAVQRGNLNIQVEASGLLEPIKVVEVKSKASGEILALHVDIGDHIQQGTLMAEIDPRDVRNALAQAQADLEVAQARVQVSEAQQKRSKELRDANVVAESDYETSVLDAANARAALIKAQTNLQLAKERMGDVRITAPITGTILTKSVEAGQIIASASQNVSGGTTLMQMADLSTMRVRTLVDETDIGKVKPGLTAEVSVEAYPGRTFVGHVEKIEPQAVVDQNVTMFPVLVLLDNQEGLLRPNMNAEVQIHVADRQDVLLIPNAAVVSMADVAAAGAVLGLDADAMRQQTRPAGGSGRPGAGNGGPEPTGGQGSQAQATPTAQERPAEGAKAANAADPKPAGTDAQVASAPSQEDCRALFGKIRQAGGPSGLSEADRATMAACRQEFAGRRGNGGGPRIVNGVEVRRAMVFVQTAQGPQPRPVELGLNDWDQSEVVSGLKEGEKVILISVARLRQQQEQMMNRIRERSSPIPGGGRGR